MNSLLMFFRFHFCTAAAQEAGTGTAGNHHIRMKQCIWFNTEDNATYLLLIRWTCFFYRKNRKLCVLMGPGKYHYVWITIIITSERIGNKYKDLHHLYSLKPWSCLWKEAASVRSTHSWVWQAHMHSHTWGLRRGVREGLRQFIALIIRLRFMLHGPTTGKNKKQKIAENRYMTVQHQSGNLKKIS